MICYYNIHTEGHKDIVATEIHILSGNFCFVNGMRFCV